MDAAPLTSWWFVKVVIQVLLFVAEGLEVVVAEELFDHSRQLFEVNEVGTLMAQLQKVG